MLGSRFDSTQITRHKIDEEKSNISYAKYKGKMVVVKRIPRDADDLIPISRLHPDFERAYPGYQIGTYQDSTDSCFVYQYYGNSLRALLIAIRKIHHYSGEYPASVILQLYVWGANFLTALQHLHHEAELVHNDVKLENFVVNAEGIVQPIDVEGARKEGALLGLVTQMSTLRDARGQLVTHGSIENDLRGAAFVIAQLVLFGTFDEHSHYDALSTIATETYPAAYHPFIRCAKMLAKKAAEPPAAGKLEFCLTFLEGCFHTWATKQRLDIPPREDDGQYQLKNIFFKKPKLETSSSCTIA